MRFKLLIKASVLMLVLSTFVFGQDLFIRKAVIDFPGSEPGGTGNIVSGLDLDKDGKVEFYAVNDNWGDTPDELIPRIYKYENNGGTWELVWMTTLNIPKQNTWPALTYGDLDKDGKGEIIWGVVNNTDDANPNPARIVVFETPGDGSDVMGIADGSGNYLPNAKWTILPSTSVKENMRPFMWEVKDIDDDGVDEIIFADRAGATSTFQIGVISVNNIPDNGDGSETWSLEFSNSVATPHFARSAKVFTSIAEIGGYGNITTGEDIDGDGKMDLYVVNDNWGDTPDEMIPRIYKFEWTGAYWEEVWKANLDIPAQNTWPPLNITDLDGDGKKEVTWAPVNNTSDASPNPARIVVFETVGDGSDIMGIADGTGNYAPNAKWSILPSTSIKENLRPFDWVVSDIDGDGKQELIFSDRAPYYHFGVIGVDKIPDNGDGSETWTLKADGKTLGITGGGKWDISVADNMIYVFDATGKVYPVKYENGTYTLLATQTIPAIYPFHSATAVDLDKDGKKEILVGDYNSSTAGKVYVLTESAGTITSTLIADVTGLATGARITGGAVGDIDNDGFADYIFGARDFDGVFRVKYKGGTITDPANYEASVLDKNVTGVSPGGQMDIIVVANIDSDPEAEVLYTGVPRGLTTAAPITIVNFNSTGKVGGNNKWDLAIVDKNIYLFAQDNIVYPVQYVNNTWQVTPSLTGVAGGFGSFKGSVVVDIDGDGTKEIVVGAWSGSGLGSVYLLQPKNGGLKSTKIADMSSLGAVRLNGAAAGDIDNDGYIDFVFGSRDSKGGIFRVEYRGGAIDDMASYTAEKIDETVIAGANQADIVTIANLDNDADLEVLYSGIPRDAALIPMVILDIQKIASTPIAEVKLDADGDFVPDNVGATYTITGIVISVNYTASSNRFSYYIQDETGAINITKGSETGGGPVFNIGQRLQATGKLGHFRGTAQLEIADLATDLVDLGVATPVIAKLVTLAEYLNNPEKYESSLIEVKYLAKTATSAAWPASNADANMTVWDGYKELTLRVDKDTDLDDNPEPVYPINVIGVATQYTSSSTVNNDGYQITPNFYAKITQGVKAPPTPYFFLQTPEDNAVVTLTTTGDTFTATWSPSVDLNNDALIYQFAFLPNKKDTVVSNPTITFKASSIVKMMAGADTLKVDWTVRTKGSESAIIASVDTFTVTFINKIVVGVEQEGLLPQEFYVDQNYPNPFNPSTTIRFGLPEAANVDLRIYNIIGQEVATLLNNQTMNAGTHNVVFDASSLASGTYIYKLNAGNKTEIKKMLLLK